MYWIWKVIQYVIFFLKNVATAVLSKMTKFSHAKENRTQYEIIFTNIKLFLSFEDMT